MAFKLDPLPYSLDALAPHISAETLDFHYNKHHQGYLAKLNAAAESTPLKDLSLEELIQGRTTNSHVSQGVYNAAAQTWNHTFYWNSMAPPAKGEAGHRTPTGAIADAIVKDFGSYDAFKKQFSDVAAGHFASGWAWLVKEKGSNKLKIIDTHDAGSAIENRDIVPLITCDVWEHAYYIDHRNARPKYIDAWWHVINWDFANKNFSKS